MSSVELRMSQPENPGEEQVASESPTCAQLISDPREARVQVRASGDSHLHGRGSTAAIDSSFNDHASSLARSQLTGLLSALFSRIIGTEACLYSADVLQQSEVVSGMHGQ